MIEVEYNNSSREDGVATLYLPSMEDFFAIWPTATIVHQDEKYIVYGLGQHITLYIKKH